MYKKMKIQLLAGGTKVNSMFCFTHLPLLPLLFFLLLPGFLPSVLHLLLLPLLLPLFQLCAEGHVGMAHVLQVGGLGTHPPTSSLLRYPVTLHHSQHHLHGQEKILGKDQHSNKSSNLVKDRHENKPYSWGLVQGRHVCKQHCISLWKTAW